MSPTRHCLLISKQILASLVSSRKCREGNTPRRASESFEGEHMNRQLLMAFVLASGMALAQTSGGSAGSPGSTDQNPQGTQTQSQPSSPSQQQPASPSDQNSQTPSNPNSNTAVSS